MAGPPPPIDENPKTPELTPARPGANGGGRLRTGNPGNKGGTGRVPNELKIAWQKMLEAKAVDLAVKKILKDPNHPQFTSLYTKLAVMVVGLPGRQDDADPEDAIPHVHMDL